MIGRCLYLSRTCNQQKNNLSIQLEKESVDSSIIFRYRKCYKILRQRLKTFATFKYFFQSLPRRFEDVLKSVGYTFTNALTRTITVIWIRSVHPSQFVSVAMHACVCINGLGNIECLSLKFIR